MELDCYINGANVSAVIGLQQIYQYQLREPLGGGENGTNVFLLCLVAAF